MLRDRGGTAALSFGAVVLPQRTDNGHRVEAGVAVEFLVLRGDGRGDQHRGDLFEGNVRAASRGGIEDLIQEVAVAVQDTGGLEL